MNFRLNLFIREKDLLGCINNANLNLIINNKSFIIIILQSFGVLNNSTRKYEAKLNRYRNKVNIEYMYALHV